jgi:hypothetical protein
MTLLGNRHAVDGQLDGQAVLRAVEAQQRQPAR